MAAFVVTVGAAAAAVVLKLSDRSLDGSRGVGSRHTEVVRRPGGQPRQRRASTAWLVVPEPIDWLEVLLKVARVGLVPHSNQAVVAAPFGFTPPFNVPPSTVTEVAAFVVTVGAAAAAVVLKLAIDPFDVPAALEAATRK